MDATRDQAYVDCIHMMVAAYSIHVWMRWPLCLYILWISSPCHGSLFTQRNKTRAVGNSGIDVRSL